MSKKLKPNQAPKSVAKERKSSDNGLKVKLLLGVLLITFVVFLPSLKNEFVNWDDDVNLMENKNIGVLDMKSVKKIFTDDVIGNYNPLPILTFAIEHHFVGFKPWLYHFNNLLLHLLCVWMAFRIASLLGLSPLFAAFVALLFGIHPMRVESVAWVTERKDVLFGFFYLLAIDQYIRMRLSKVSIGKWLLICVLAILALFSKIQAVSLPLSLLAIDYFMKRPLNFKIVLEKAPLFLFSLIFGLVGVYMLKNNDSLVEATSYGVFDRLTVGAYSFFIYLIKFIFPYPMSPLYPYPDTLSWYHFAAMVPSTLVLVLMVYLYKKGERFWLFGLMFFLVNVAFVLQILGAGQGFLADRFTYIPYLGLFISVAFFLERYASKEASRKLVFASCSAFLAISAFMSYRQSMIWKNGETLWTHVLKYETKTPLPWTNRAMYYRNLKQYDRALADFNRGLELKKQGTTYNSIGKLYFDQGNAVEALKNYNECIKLDTTMAEFFINRGAAFAMLGQYPNALIDMTHGIAKDKENLNGYLNRSLLHFTMENYELAILDHNEYLNRNPANYGIYYERGICFAALGKFQEAVNDFSKAINADGQGVYYQERGKANFMINKRQEAIQDIRKAQELGVQVPEGVLKQVGLM